MGNAENRVSQLVNIIPFKVLHNIEALIDSLKDYENVMLYKKLDFDSERTVQCKEFRVMMAKLYEKDTNLFATVA